MLMRFLLMDIVGKLLEIRLEVTTRMFHSASICSVLRFEARFSIMSFIFETSYSQMKLLPKAVKNFMVRAWKPGKALQCSQEKSSFELSVWNASQKMIKRSISFNCKRCETLSIFAVKMVEEREISTWYPLKSAILLPDSLLSSYIKYKYLSSSSLCEHCSWKYF